MHPHGTNNVITIPFQSFARGTVIGHVFLQVPVPASTPEESSKEPTGITDGRRSATALAW